MGGLIGVAGKANAGLVPAGYAPLRFSGTSDKYIKLGFCSAYSGHTINMVAQQSGQRLAYANYIIQMAGGTNTDIEPAADVTTLALGEYYQGNNPKFYTKDTGNGCDLYCTSKRYQEFAVTSPTGFPFDLSMVDALPSDAKEVTVKQ